MSREEIRFLADVAARPLSTTVSRYQRLNLSRRRGNAIRQSLSSAGIIEAVQIATRSGQIVLYPIVHMPTARLKVVEYVEKLETVMIRTAADWGVPARRDARNRGVWVGNHKLGSIGIAIQRGVSFHGLAFNVDPDLAPFGWINPCGLQGIGITSLGCELKRPVPMEEVMNTVRRHFASVFGIELETLSLSGLREKAGPVG